MTPKEIERLRKRASKKNTWIMSIMVVFALLMYLGFVWLYWSRANKFALKAGITFLEIPNYDLSGVYPGYQIKALESFYFGFLGLICTVFIITGWIIGFSLRLRDRKILNYMDELKKENEPPAQPDTVRRTG